MAMTWHASSSAASGDRGRLAMIDLYTWTTPNGRKISIMLEECGLEYRACPVDLTKDEQFSTEFSSLSPANKIPVIVDHDEDVVLMESGAILVYLAEKTGRFLPVDRSARLETLQWLMYQVGNIGPVFGQAHQYLHYHPHASEYAARKFHAATQQHYGVLDRRLAGSAWLGGDEYTIADIATWPWVSRYEWQRIDLNEFGNVRRWYLEVAVRPAVQRGYDVPHRVNAIPMP